MEPDQNSTNDNWLKRKLHSYSLDFKKQFLNIPRKKLIKNICLIFFGNVLLAFATVFFLVPGKIVMGGNSGLALIIMGIINNSMNGTQPSWIDTDFIILLLTIFFFILAFILLGFSAAIKNTISAITYPSFVYIFGLIRNIPSFNYIRIEEYMTTFSSPINGGYDPAVVALVSGIFGGVLMGLATSLTFKGGGSAGGTTCLIVFFSKHTLLKANTISIILDSIIIGAGLFIYKDLIIGMIGIITAIICAQIISKVFVGGTQALHAEVITPHWEELSMLINKKMKRGTTIYTAHGGFTGEERKVIYVSFSKEEYHRFVSLVDSIDPAAFVTITTIYDISGGYGFDKKIHEQLIKHHEKQKDKETK